MTRAASQGYSPRNCPVCDDEQFRTVLTLAPTPLGDRFAATADEAKKLPHYPLEVVRCEQCDHAFVPWLTNSDASYSHYLFHSGNSPLSAETFQEVADDMSLRHRLSESDIIVDIGANDGTWLNCFRSSGAELVAIEPAPRPASVAATSGLSVIRDYFSKSTVNDSGLVDRPPRLVSLNYVFANLPSPREALREIIELSDESTVISILTGYHPAQLEVKMFDYVYHEHLSYFSGVDFQKLCNELGLVVTYVREIPLKGGSIHIELRQRTETTNESSVFQQMLKRERWLDDPRDSQWESLAVAIDEVGGWVRNAVVAAQETGIPVIGFGASHSTTTLSYALGIEEELDFIIDDNTVKQGLYAPGSAIPVHSPDVASRYKNSLVVVLAWQHGPQILESIRRHGISGRTLTPFPVYRLEAIT